MLESWQHVWRKGISPLLSDEGLKALKDALIRDEPKLLQGVTTTPPPLMAVQDWPCEGACALGYCGWVGDGLTTVGEVEEFFARLCFEVDQLMGEPAAIRYWLNWADETPRDEMRIKLLAEIERSLAGRPGS